ncbi:MAG: dTDP-4-dehydrorhamnose reductase [Chitinophagaceae bacterium]|nr:dTDP-4-dehydrorhamnose reductase [Chitinophagaceae bacterium]
MTKPLIVVTGVQGQLGWEIQALHGAFLHQYDFLFLSRQAMDLSAPGSITEFFSRYQPAVVINCAAYTAVDKAETEQALAYTINAEAVAVLAQQCATAGTRLIHFSTDYVFNGRGTEPYQPGDATDPVNYYGYTKREGELLALQYHAQTTIIRTSWVYSSHGHNFVRTMLRLMKEKTSINVVNDQWGAPTYAADLAAAVMQIIEQPVQHNGIYHYANKGLISWYDFALAIRELAGLDCAIHPIPSSAYPTPAKRPAYSAMDTSSFETDFGIRIPDWKESLRTALPLF